MSEQKPEAQVSPVHAKTRTLPGYLGVSARGVCMGVADVIPGVSGGTMALILGIYDELIASVRAFDLHALKLFFSGRFRQFAQYTNLSFLLFLATGIFTAILSLAKVIPQLLVNYPKQVNGLFFGLILASIFLVWKQVNSTRIPTLSLAALGAVAAFLLVGLSRGTTPTHPAIIFLCGAIAIIAMILPGISGSFLLLIMGKYSFILSTLNTVRQQRALDQHLMILVVFAAGCAVGLLLFSRVLHWLLEHYHTQTLALLTGLMIGSLRRIWPFQTYVYETIGHKSRVVSYNNVLPAGSSSDFLAVGLVAVGFLVVLAMHFFANPSTSSTQETATQE
ncbi:MAG: DUF368 domain-containing protein [Myxococcota bacterium]